MWQTSWQDLWRYMDRVSCTTLTAWADQHQCRTLIIPPCGEWAYGLYVIQLPDATRYSFPLSAIGDVPAYQGFCLSDAQWAGLAALCESQYSLWSRTLDQLHREGSRSDPA